MEIKPNLFTTPATPSARSQREVSEARLAFEAMLSAGAARQTIAKTNSPAQNVRSVAPSNTEIPTDEAQAPISRPGRVLNIRV
jgi:hypothetical protein